MKRFFCLFLLLIGFFLNSCSTTSKSVSLGVGVGAGTGAAAGAILRGDGKGATFSALVFGILGGLSGYLTHKSLQKRDEKVRNEIIFNLENYGAHRKKRPKKCLLSDKWQGEKLDVSTKKRECLR